MPVKLYLGLLIIFGVWSERIIGNFTDQNIKESSSFLLRQKRVVSHVRGEDKVSSIQNHPYVVSINVYNSIYCVGTILSHRVVITAALCASFHKTKYKVVSSSTNLNHAIAVHNVTFIMKQSNNFSRRISENIALFTIDPPIVYSRYSNKIDIHGEPLLGGELATVIGWGYNNIAGISRGTAFPSKLRSIEVPIISHDECVQRYGNHYSITEKDICTLHPQKRAGHIDHGAPLVINNTLVGIFLMRGPAGNIFGIQYPDIFAFVQHADYRRWIWANI